ncbi:MAG: peptidoglycan-binding protein [Burkholderiaceae bacterium]|nr:peptidoglycan-binding protein [Burkholderiaceae bacterium]
MSRTMRVGDQGSDVRAVQDVLNFHIRRLAPLVVDGRFGPQTQARVREFQRSNALTIDGVVGPQTLGKLFENEVQQITVGIIPRLLLTLPTSGGAKPAGIRPPNLIPPLVLPGQPTPPSPVPIPFPSLTQLRLLPDSRTPIPALNPRGQLLQLSLTVPSRNDPVDPAVKSFRQIVQLLETLPPNFPFRTQIIGAVPNPVKKIGDIDFGFQWGIDPIFDLKQLSGPTEFTVGAKANASYTLKVIDRPGPAGLKLGFFAKGDFKGELDYTSPKAESRPLMQLEGTILLGVDGRF